MKRLIIALVLLAGVLWALPAVAQEGGRPAAESDWSRVRRLASGTEIVVTTGTQPAPPYAVRGQRFVLQVGESGLTAVNLADLTTSQAAADVLRDAASKHPEYFAAARQGRTYTLRNGVRVGPGGVFADGRRVAALQQILESIDRSDVVQVVQRHTTTHGSAKRVLAGTGLGFLLTMVAAGNGGTGPNYCTTHPRGCLVVIGAGTAAGAGAGYWGGKDETSIQDVVIYRRQVSASARY